MSRTQVVLLVDYLILNHIGGSYSFVYRQDGLLVSVYEDGNP